MIRKQIDKIADYSEELFKIEYNISILLAMAHTIDEQMVENIDFIIETLPSNGARPKMMKLYPQKQFVNMFSNPESETKPEQPIGFQRWYTTEDLPPKEGSLMITVELDHRITSAILETALNRLRRRKSEIYRDTHKIMKAP